MIDFENKKGYKDSGIEWIGYIPDEWNITKLKNIIPDIFTGTTPPSKINKYYEGDIKWITIRDLKGKYVSEGKRNISQLFLNEFPQRYTKKGDLLFSFKLSIGQVAFASNTFITNEAIMTIPKSQDYNVNYMYYALPVFIVKNAIKNIYDADLLNRHLIQNANLINIPKQEQKRIADYLDQKTELADKKIEVAQKRKKLLLEYKKSLINQVVTKGLRFDLDFENKAGLSEKEFDLYMKDNGYKNSGIKWIGWIPTGWEVSKLKNIINDIFTGTTPPSNNNKYYEGDIKWITIGDLNGKYVSEGKRNISQLFLNEFPQRYTKKGDLLFSFKLSIGQVAFASTTFITNEAIMTIPKSEDYNVNYMYYSLPIFVVKNAIKNIYDADLLNRHLIQNSNIINVSKQEQTKIANFLDHKTAQIDEEVTKLDKEIELIKEFKRTLINDVVTGKIRV